MYPTQKSWQENEDEPIACYKLDKAQLSEVFRIEPTKPKGAPKQPPRHYKVLVVNFSCHMQLDGALKVSLQDIQPVELWPGREPITLSMESSESFFMWKSRLQEAMLDTYSQAPNYRLRTMQPYMKRPPQHLVRKLCQQAKGYILPLQSGLKEVLQHAQKGMSSEDDVGMHMRNVGEAMLKVQYSVLPDILLHVQRPSASKDERCSMDAVRPWVMQIMQWWEVAMRHISQYGAHLESCSVVQGAQTFLGDLHDCIYCLLDGIQQQQQPRTVEVVLKRDPQTVMKPCHAALSAISLKCTPHSVRAPPVNTVPHAPILRQASVQQKLAM